MNYKEKLNKVKTFVFDVDGVFTDGKVYLFKDELIRALNSKDGYAVQYASKLGYKIFVITGGDSQEVKKRLEGLGVEKVVLKSKNKVKVLDDLQKEYNLTLQEILYMGDDIPDLPVFPLVGVSTCPSDACIDVLKAVDYPSRFAGGKGCVRDVIEQTLRVQDNWLKEQAYEW